jgi:hypothetical protein
MRRSAAFEQLQDLDHALADARKVGMRAEYAHIRNGPVLCAAQQ